MLRCNAQLPDRGWTVIRLALCVNVHIYLRAERRYEIRLHFDEHLQDVKVSTFVGRPGVTAQKEA